MKLIKHIDINQIFYEREMILNNKRRIFDTRKQYININEKLLYEIYIILNNREQSYEIRMNNLYIRKEILDDKYKSLEDSQTKPNNFFIQETIKIMPNSIDINNEKKRLDEIELTLEYMIKKLNEKENIINSIKLLYDNRSSILDNKEQEIYFLEDEMNKQEYLFNYTKNKNNIIPIIDNKYQKIIFKI